MNTKMDTKIHSARTARRRTFPSETTSFRGGGGGGGRGGGGEGDSQKKTSLQPILGEGGGICLSQW